MQRAVDRKLVAAAALAMALLAVNATLAFTNTTLLRDARASIGQSRSVMLALSEMLSAAKDAESGQRGYLISGNFLYLDPYTVARRSVGEQLDKLDELTRGDPARRARLDEIRKRVYNRLDMLDAGIRLRQERGFEAVREGMQTNRGKAEMDALREAVVSTLDAEEIVLRERQGVAETSYRIAVTTGLLSALAAFASVLAMLFLLRRHLRARDVAAATLGAQAELLRTTLASIGDAVVTTDLEARVTDMNSVAEAVTGWSVAEARGQPLEAVFRIVGEKTREVVASPATRALAEGVIVGLANHTLLIDRLGVDHPIDDSAAPIRSRDGSVIGCVLVFRDITARKAAERALHEAEARVRMALMQMGTPALLYADDGEVLLVNQAFVEHTGYRPDDVSTVDAWTRRAYGERQQAVLEIIDALFRMDQRVDSGEREIRIANGELRTWHFFTGPAGIDAAGRRLMITTAIDVTEQKQIEGALRAADKRKDAFLALLGHELRNPLAPIGNALAIMKTAAAGGAELAAARETVDRQFGTLVRLVDDLLDANRIRLGKLTLRVERVELLALMRHVAAATLPRAENGGQSLEFATGHAPVWLDADPARLTQMLDNLIANALKFTPAGGHVHVGVRSDDGVTVIEVRDDGVGIAADELGGIFDPFVQLDASLERAQSGLGLGLALVKQLAEMHGGSVVAESGGAGKGATFTVRLPIAAAHPDKRNGATPAHVAPRRILVVDDNHDSAESLAALLQLDGHETRIAHDGAEAVDAAMQMRPDAILLDIGLPILNGYDACRRIRDARLATDPLIIALTGWSQDSDRQRSSDAGFDAHLVKPVDFAALAALLASPRQA